MSVELGVVESGEYFVCPSCECKVIYNDCWGHENIIGGHFRFCPNCGEKISANLYTPPFYDKNNTCGECRYIVPCDTGVFMCAYQAGIVKEDDKCSLKV